jgi:ribonuclease HII
VDIGLGVADVEEIDRINILQATHAAMARAVAGLTAPPDFILVDGLPVGGLPCRSAALVGGDALSLSIAAASVVAKVVRDAQMRRLDEEYPVYGFARHKGYGSQAHIQALYEHGPCPLHRRSFRPVREAEELHRRLKEEPPDDEIREDGGLAP